MNHNDANHEFITGSRNISRNLSVINYNKSRGEVKDRGKGSAVLVPASTDFGQESWRKPNY